MKTPKPLTKKQRRFAETHHDMVYAFLRSKNLDADEFYDVVIFGYLRAVCKYTSDPELRKYAFTTIAWDCMECDLYNYYRYLNRPIRNAPIVSLNSPAYPNADLTLEDVLGRKDRLMQELEMELLLHDLAASLPSREMRIIHMKVRGDRMHDIAKAEHLTFQQINSLLSSAYPTILSILRG